jgi:hypothetical protein
MTVHLRNTLAVNRIDSGFAMTLVRDAGDALLRRLILIWPP